MLYLQKTANRNRRFNQPINIETLKDRNSSDEESKAESNNEENKEIQGQKEGQIKQIVLK